MKKISIVAAVLVFAMMVACGRSNDRPAETATNAASVSPKDSAKDGGAAEPLTPDESFAATEVRDGGGSVTALANAKDGGSGVLSTRGGN